MKLHLRRLVLSNVHPSDVGVFIGPDVGDGRALTLTPLHNTLQVRACVCARVAKRQRGTEGRRHTEGHST